MQGEEGYRGVQINCPRCKKLFVVPPAAAEQGDADAQLNLGVCYYNGKGVAVNNVEAVKWFRKAAKQGEASAQYNLAVCYANGTGVERNKVEAVKWFRKAGKQGDRDAQAAAESLERDLLHEKKKNTLHSQNEVTGANTVRLTVGTGPSCPLCGGQLERMDAGLRGIAFGAGNLLGAFTHTHRCSSCGHLV
jgi:hypothetical protein